MACSRPVLVALLVLGLPFFFAACDDPAEVTEPSSGAAEPAAASEAPTAMAPGPITAAGPELGPASGPGPVLEPGAVAGPELQPVSGAGPSRSATAAASADGLNDFIWQNRSTGKLIVWLMSDTTRDQDAAVGQVADTDWRIKGVGDYEGSGTRDDLVWHHVSTGEIVVWEMDGTSRTNIVSVGTVSNTDWWIVGTGDYEGSGVRDDLAWHNGASGKIVVWEMSGTSRTNVVSVGTVSNTDWRIRAVGDVSESGTPDDLVWRNPSTGGTVLWEMDGTAHTNVVHLSTAAAAWKVETTGDYEGDGFDNDITWRRPSTGDDVVWEMDGTSRVAIHRLREVGNPDWRIEGIGQFAAGSETLSASIDSPSDGAEIEQGQSITWSGTATDPEDGTLSGSSLNWKSDVDGSIGSGERFSTSGILTADTTHRIIFTATDSDGNSAADTIDLTIWNVAPVASITVPSSDTSVATGDSLTLEGQVDDPQADASFTLDARWMSHVEGELVRGSPHQLRSHTTRLSADTSHRVSLVVTDREGAVDTSTVHVAVGLPAASIEAPSSDTVVTAGSSITLQGSARDPETGQLTGTSLNWHSSRDGQLGTGESVTVSDLSAGEHVITLSATDSDGNSGTDSVGIGVNAPPSVSIEMPSEGTEFDRGQAVTFEGSASDPEDGQLAGSQLVWKSNQDGELGTGGSVTVSGLSTGPHTVTLTATDSDGVSATASVGIHINAPPSASISVPDSGTHFNQGETVTLEGGATDPEDGPITGASLVWHSSRDGQLGTGETVTISSLSSGPHLLRLTATDSNGATDSDSVRVTVGSPPTVEVTAPTNESVFAAGETITFEGSASDSEDGQLTGSSLVWRSSQEGRLGTGETLTISSLSDGAHLVSLTATDSDSLRSKTSIQLLVESSGFDVRVAFVDDQFTASQRETIRNAAKQVESVITGDLPSRFVDPSVDPECFGEATGVDDLYICVKANSMSGAWARAADLAVRSGSGLPVAGIIWIDPGDVSHMVANGILDDVTLHETGHVVTSGPQWSGFVENVPSYDPYLSGPTAVSEFESIGGEAYLSDPVPLERTPAGTAGRHWRAENLGDELMTPFISTGAEPNNPLSRVTVGVLADLGYTVDMSAAESLTLPMPQTAVWAATADATLSRPVSSTDNFGTPDGSLLSNSIVAGANNGTWSSDDPSDEIYSALLRFEHSSIPANVSLVQAELHLQRRDVDGSNTDREIELVRVTSGWTEDSVTWDGRPSFATDSVLAYSHSTCATCRLTSSEFRSLIRDWATGTLANHGLGLRAPGASSEPTFSVGYWTRHTDEFQVRDRPRINVQAEMDGVSAAIREGGGDAADASRQRVASGSCMVRGPLFMVRSDGTVRRIR